MSVEFVLITLRTWFGVHVRLAIERQNGYSGNDWLTIQLIATTICSRRSLQSCLRQRLIGVTCCVTLSSSRVHSFSGTSVGYYVRTAMSDQSLVPWTDCRSQQWIVQKLRSRSFTTAEQVCNYDTNGSLAYFLFCNCWHIIYVDILHNHIIFLFIITRTFFAPNLPFHIPITHTPNPISWSCIYVIYSIVTVQ